jgi:biofilm PGA synthesis N-glycosyltransferase PgaC
MKDRNYVLVTPARNEEGYIARTIESVLSQTVLPQRWVIVSDGSVDRTDEIVESYLKNHPFIQLLKKGQQGKLGEKDFGSKVRAFRAGYGLLGGQSYAFVGNLDADITFEPDYHEQILDRFHANPRLGLAGGMVLEPQGNRYVPQNTSLNSVCGSVQLFRREAYEATGGYIPMRMGGVDAAAEIMVRMHGWAVQTFPEIQVRATRPVLTGGATILSTKYRQGISNYLLGYHPIFQLASCLSRIGDKPFLIGSVLTLLGYSGSYLRRYKRTLPDEVVRFLRSEQTHRLVSSLTSRRARHHQNDAIKNTSQF